MVNQVGSAVSVRIGSDKGHLGYYYGSQFCLIYCNVHVFYSVPAFFCAQDLIARIEYSDKYMDDDHEYRCSLL